MYVHVHVVSIHTVGLSETISRLLTDFNVSCFPIQSNCYCTSLTIIHDVHVHVQTVPAACVMQLFSKLNIATCFFMSIYLHVCMYSSLNYQPLCLSPRWFLYAYIYIYMPKGEVIINLI